MNKPHTCDATGTGIEYAAEGCRQVCVPVPSPSIPILEVGDAGTNVEWAAKVSDVSESGVVITLGEQYEPRRHLIVVHGFGMYNELYRSPVESILHKDDRAGIYNIPGHGVAASDRSAVSPTVSGRALGELANRIVADTLELNDARVFVLGESLGCAVAARVVRRLHDVGRRPTGIILAAPPLILNPLTLLRWSIAPLSRPLSTFTDGVDIAEAILDMVGDSEIANQIRNDPAVVRRVSIRYVIDALASLVEMATVDLRGIDVPLLGLVGAEDPLVSSRSLRVAASLVRSKDTTAQVIPRARHSLFWDPETRAVCRTIRAWMDEHDPEI